MVNGFVQWQTALRKIGGTFYIACSNLMATYLDKSVVNDIDLSVVDETALRVEHSVPKSVGVIRPGGRRILPDGHFPRAVAEEALRIVQDSRTNRPRDLISLFSAPKDTWIMYASIWLCCGAILWRIAATYWCRQFDSNLVFRCTPR
jgi:hypothetical protein